MFTVDLMRCTNCESNDPLTHMGRFPFTKRFRKFRLGCKWNMIFRFVPLENFRKSGTSEKVVPFSRWKFSDGNLCSIYGFRKGLPVPGRSQPLFFIPSGNMAGNMAATSSASPSAFYECSVCHGLAPDLERLLHHNCAMYANSPANVKQYSSKNKILYM